MKPIKWISREELIELYPMNEYMEAKTMSEQQADHYFHGDACIFTGNTRMLHGGLFYEYLLIEGHREGEIIYSQKTPNCLTTAKENQQ